jgi:hypothetical protein
MDRKPIPPEFVELLSGADEATRSRLEPRLTRAVNVCGCSSGAVALLLGIALSVLWWLTQRGGRMLMWREAVIFFLAVVAATALAKLGAIVVARLWLAWTRRRLERRFGRASWSTP